MIGDAGEPAIIRFDGTFTLIISMPNLLKAYVRAVLDFFSWYDRYCLGARSGQLQLLARTRSSHHVGGTSATPRTADLQLAMSAFAQPSSA